MSEPTCYYYNAERNRCNCYINENLNELLADQLYDMGEQLGVVCE